MIKRSRFPKIFFGWWTVLASGILALWGYAYQAYGFSALFKPISSELGFSRATTSVAASIGRFEGGFEAPLTGWVTDKFGPRWLVLAGVFLISISLILMNWINSLWAFYVVWGIVLGTGVNIALSVPLDTAISNWFVKKRGVALSLKWIGSGLSGVIGLPLVSWLITVQGWRTTCVIGGLVMALVGLPLAWFCLRPRRPEYYGLLPDGATTEDETTDISQMIDRGVAYAASAEEREFTIRQAIRTPTYWLLLAAQAAHNLVAPSINMHSIPFLTDMGIDPLKAAGIMVILVASSIPARFVGGLITDRIGTNRLRFLMAVAYLLEGAGIAIFLLNPSMATIYIWFVVYGIGYGTGLTVSSVIRARYFGRKAFGSIYGTSMMLLAPAGVLAPIYAGWVYDTNGTYLPAFTLFAILLAVAVIILPFARPPKPPAQVTDIRKIV